METKNLKFDFEEFQIAFLCTKFGPKIFCQISISYINPTHFKGFGRFWAIFWTKIGLFYLENVLKMAKIQVFHKITHQSEARFGFRRSCLYEKATLAFFSWLYEDFDMCESDSRELEFKGTECKIQILSLGKWETRLNLWSPSKRPAQVPIWWNR